MGRNLIYCRIIGHIFHHYPTDRALSVIVSEVLSCQNREDFLSLGQMYYSYLVRVCELNLIKNGCLLVNHLAPLLVVWPT